MKQTKKTKLALATETVRTLAGIHDERLRDVAGGSLIHTRVVSQCATNQTTACTW